MKEKKNLNPFGSDDESTEDESESVNSPASIVVQTPEKVAVGLQNETELEKEFSPPATIVVQTPDKEAVETQMEAAGTRKEAGSSNPFEDSSDEEEEDDMKTTASSNPFLNSGDEDEQDEFDESNPFAEDARAEIRQSIRSASLSVPSSFQRNSSERLSQKDRVRLKKFGVEESNPFAEDLLEDEETDEIDVSTKITAVTTNSTTNKKKMVLKTRQGNKVRAPAPPSPNNLSTTAQQTPKSKKRAAPKAPTTAPAIDPQSRLRRSVKKRAAPPPPSQAAAQNNSETDVVVHIPQKPPRRESSKSNTLPGMAQYANVVFDNGNLLSIDAKRVNGPSTAMHDDDDHIYEKTIPSTPGGINDSDVAMATDENQSGVASATDELNGTDNCRKTTDSISSDNDVDSINQDTEKEEASLMEKDIETNGVEGDIGKRESEHEEEEGTTEEGDDVVGDLPSSKETVEPKLSRQKSNEKRKAPSRPPLPNRTLNENQVLANLVHLFFHVIPRRILII